MILINEELTDNYHNKRSFYFFHHKKDGCEGKTI